MSEPTRTHPFVKGDGTIRNYEEITTVKCPSCNPHGMRENGVFGVLSDTEGTVTLECLHCASTQYMKSGELEARRILEERGIDVDQ